jgi:hypothetical protein
MSSITHKCCKAVAIQLRNDVISKTFAYNLGRGRERWNGETEGWEFVGGMSVEALVISMKPTLFVIQIQNVVAFTVLSIIK